MEGTINLFEILCMKGTHIMKYIFISIGLVLILQSCGNRPGQPRETGKTNFIVIYTDELQFSDLGCYGGTIPTPNIDRLASEGLLFTSAYTTASMCTPSRYSVLTGQFPGRCSAPSFLKENPVDEPYNIAWNSWITEDKETLARVLSENGFITGMAGKWHIGRVDEGTVLPHFQTDDPLDDPQVDQKLRELQQTYQQVVRTQGGFDFAASVVWSNNDAAPIKALQFHNFPWMVQGALTFLEQQKGSDIPFFLYFAPTAIHGPNHVEDLARDVTYTPGGRDTSLTRWQVDVPSLLEELSAIPEKDRHRYAGMVETDHVVGLIREKLDELGLTDHTVIIFISDHNIEPGKATSFEKGIHVPCIVYWPGITSGGSRNAMVQNIDIYPTILEAAGIPLPDHYPLDGVSMMRLIKDPDQSIREYLFAENGYTRSVSDGRYKYIALRYPQSLVEEMENGELDHVPSYVKAWPQAHSAIAMQFFPAYFDQDQLYNLEADPYEQENLYATMTGSDELKELQGALQDHLATFSHPFSLERIPFMQKEAYQKLKEKNLSFDIYTIPWLGRDHGQMVWPPESK
jgi:arylsulfatase A-like enzyme